MGLVVADDRWRMPDWLWERLEPLLPPPPSHPLGCHRARVPDRDAMDAILADRDAVERAQRDRHLFGRCGRLRGSAHGLGLDERAHVKRSAMSSGLSSGTNALAPSLQHAPFAGAHAHTRARLVWCIACGASRAQVRFLPEAP